MYLKLPHACNLISYGDNIVARISKEYRGIVEQYINKYPAERCFETPNMYILNDAFQEAGFRVCFMAEYFLPDLQVLTALPCDYDIKVLKSEDFKDLYTAEWSNALCEDRKELDVLGMGAYHDGKLIGLAACSADCDTMWQIGVDVLSKYRRKGIAAALTSRLATEILERGKVPFYCCDWSNLKSARNAIKSGFRPAWIELTVNPASFVEEIGFMIYLSSFKLSDYQVTNPNIYPYNVFRGKYIEPFVFAPITVFYGNNGSGKSTLLNIIANSLELKGKEYATSNSYGNVDYCGSFSSECSYSLGEDDFGRTIKKLPEGSRYIKSEDILYEIKKIQQKQVLSDGMEYDYVQRGMSLQEARQFLASKEGRKQEEYILFAQEKYSNGETSLQYFEEYLHPNALYLLDEPEVSLSAANQVALAEEINKMARLLQCQFIIATHSPFMLGTLHAKIYNLDSKEYDIAKWSDLENVRYFYNFFKRHEKEFL